MLILVLRGDSKRFSLLFKSVKEQQLAIAVIIIGRAITIWEAIQKKSHELIYKTDTKSGAKKLRVITFAIAKKSDK